MPKSKVIRLAYAVTLTLAAGCSEDIAPSNDTASAYEAESSIVCQRDYIAAGILPYTIRNGRIFLLLGEESRTEGTVWTDFIGTRVDKDCTPVVTAAREFGEESRGTYPSEQTAEAIRSVNPTVIDAPRVYFWILKVDDIPAREIEKGQTGRYSEKSHYCWVDLADLLAGIDADTRRIPRRCGGHSSGLYHKFEQNLAEGGVARAQLETLLRHHNAP
jgi:8-oxo-dGTP pyrophosphatase MutT (NUDIX family)